jgi:cytochrome c556
MLIMQGIATMNMRLLNCVAIVSLMLGGLAAWGVAQQPRLSEGDRNELSVLMRAKLSSSQKVVEGLMAGDFEMIRKGAQDLQRICDATGWRSHDDPIYGMYRTELKRSAGKMIEQATARNLDGAAYGYMHTVTTCINCHDHCRTVLRVAEVRPQVIPIPVTEAENLARQPLPLYR